MPEPEFARIARWLAHLAAGWRDWDDLEALARLPDGTVRVDIRAGTATHGTAGPVALRLAPALRDALEERLAAKGIPPAAVEAAVLDMRVDTGAIRTERRHIVHFDFDLEARVRAKGEDYPASRREDHVWHARERD
jgi:hypothetical protein